METNRSRVNPKGGTIAAKEARGPAEVVGRPAGEPGRPSEPRYTDLDELKSAVLEAAGENWRAAAGRYMTDHDRANFVDRDLPEHERRALEIRRELSDVLVKLAAFATDYQSVPGTQTVVDGDGNTLPVSSTHETRDLLRVVEDEYAPHNRRSIFEAGLSGLDGRVRDSEGKPILVSRIPVDADGNRIYRTPAIVNWLKPQPSGWRAKKRGRVASLLGDLRTSNWSTRSEFRKNLGGVGAWFTRKGLAKEIGCAVDVLPALIEADEVEQNPEGNVRKTAPGNTAIDTLIARGEVEMDSTGRLRSRTGYWLEFGFSGPPTARLMACGTLMLRSWPTISDECLAKGVTVEEVIAREERRITEINKSRSDPDRLPFGERAAEKLRVFEAKLDELEESGDLAARERFMRDELVPFYNSASTEDLICEECLATFEMGATRPSRRRGRTLPIFCSIKCGGRRRMRGQPPHDGRSEMARSEIARRKKAQWNEEHVKTCARCLRGGPEPCSEISGGIAYLDAMDPGRTGPLRGHERISDDGFDDS